MTSQNSGAIQLPELRRSEQITYAGSVLRRAVLLTDLPILRYSFSQPDNLLQFRNIMDSYEQAALSRAEVSERRSHHLIIDEFHSFSTQSSHAFSSMLSQTRKYGLYLGLAHQFWGQANHHLQEVLQNTGIEVVFNVGRTDAEYTAKELCRIDLLQVKQEVTDEYASEKIHPVFYNLGEQW